jgi:cation:H+ antiporter
MTIFLQILGGILFLWGGAELLIRSGASLALRFGLPIMIIGLIVLGFGTGTPELFVSIQATLIGKGDIAIGNVIGSNIANGALILGVSAISNPIKIQSTLVKQDLPIMLFTSIVFSILLLTHPVLDRSIGVCFIAGLIAYSYFSILLAKEENELIEKEKEEIKHYKMRFLSLELLVLFIGFVLLFFGGKFFLDGSITIAKIFNISDAVIGVTIIALGTSLPELAVSLIASRKKHGDVSIGNVVGSNIFNILGIIGFITLFNPIEVKGITIFQNLFMTGLAFVMWFIARTNWLITRKEGVILLASYFVFILYNVFIVIN